MSAGRVLVRLMVPMALLLAGSLARAELRVQVDGVSGNVKRNIEAHLAIARLAEDARASARASDARVRRLHERAPSDIRAALQALGYYSGVVDASLAGEPGNRLVTYVVTRGPRSHWREPDIRLTGEAAYGNWRDRWLKDLPLKAGKSVHHGRYEAAKRWLLDRLYADGYLEAHIVTARMDVDPSQAEAAIHWEVESGPRFHFGAIRLEQDVLNAEFAQRFVGVTAGSPFSTQRLADLQLGLMQSGYFDDVRIDADRSAAAGHSVPVVVRAHPARSQRYEMGVGYGTDSGPRAKVGTEFRRLNRRGHRLRANLQTAVQGSTLAMDYAIPVGDVTTDVLRFHGQAERAQVGDADIDQYELGARLEDGWYGMRRALYVRYAREQFNFGSGPHQRADILVPGIELLWQQGDDLLFTRRGFSVRLDAHGGTAGVLSDTDFVQVSGAAHLVLPLGDRSRLLLRGAMGLVEARDFDALPPSERFFTGGDRSVRGYAFESLSPENAAGDDIGGSHFFNQSVEVDRLVYKDFGVAAFFDRGGASRRVFGGQHEAVGVGIRYKSRIGMIRVDVAHPLDGSANFRIHLTLGPDL
ncbi:MAG: BamA/TamA family outer membrane protein [Pseudomonadales bacterium]